MDAFFNQSHNPPQGQTNNQHTNPHLDMMSADDMAFFNGFTMTRASSTSSMASDHLSLHGRMDKGTYNEIGSVTQSVTPSDSFSNSEGPAVGIHDHQQSQLFQQQQQQQHSDQSLASSAKNKKLFPQKLWDLINDERYSFCLRWSDDGQLVYFNRDEFEESYLKTSENQFHTQKAISFVRQMNMYGFRKVDDCYYENDNFKKGCEHLLKNMIRKHPNKTISPRALDLGPRLSPEPRPIDYRKRHKLSAKERLDQLAWPPADQRTKQNTPDILQSPDLSSLSLLFLVLSHALNKSR